MMLDLSIAEASDLLRRKEISPVDLTNACLDRIEQLNPKTNAFITVMRDSALAQAREAEEEIGAGQWRGSLHGIPIGLKDLIDTAGVKTTCGSELFADRVPSEDAEVVTLLKKAGAVLIGKQNLQEFAWGGTSASSYYGPVRNPWDLERIAGGSSGGSAAAVASRMCYGAIGTDTGGSVREPAAFCGLVGLKATYGRVSTDGVFPLSQSLDHVGPLCRTVTDAALMFEVMAGCDKFELNLKTKPRIGVVRRPFLDDLDPDIEKAFDEALKDIQVFSASVSEITLPPTPAFVQGPEVYAVHSQDFAATPHKYGRWMQERLKQASTLSNQDYVRSLHELEQLRRNIDEVFANVDIVLTPTTPVPPITIEEALNMSPDPAGELWLRNTRPFNAYAIPTISIPCGFTRAGLTIGLQIAAHTFNEEGLLSFAYAYEQSTGWQRRLPSLIS